MSKSREARDDDIPAILDAYWPVVEAVRKVRAHYAGKLGGPPRICSDVVGDAITALNKAEKKIYVKVEP